MATTNGICSETFHKILSENGIKETCTILGGSDSYTRDMFCLPNDDVPLPLRHYKIVFPTEVNVKAVISSFKTVLGEDIGFFVFVSSNLKSSLEESYQTDEQAKQHLSIVHEASQPITNISSDMKPSQRLCALVLLYSFIVLKANARALRVRGTCAGPFNDIDNALKRDCKRYKSQIVREAQRSLIYSNN